MSLSRKEACQVSKRGLTWLKTHQCGWCDQNALHAIMYGCCSIYGPRCDPAKRFSKPSQQQTHAPEDQEYRD
jgi:hypothetical protein